MRKVIVLYYFYLELVFNYRKLLRLYIVFNKEFRKFNHRFLENTPR